MCRYSFKTYKSHFVCFNCRKTFKQVPYSDLLRRIGKAEQYDKLIRKPVKSLTDKEVLQIDWVESTFSDREIKCPQCERYMADLGLDFKSPKKTAEKEWKIIEGLFTIGKSFYSCGCSGVGYVPQKPADYRVYLERILEEYEETIAHYRRKSLKECRDKAERIAYWSEKKEMIRLEMEKLG